MDNDQINSLAEKIAKVISSEKTGTDLTSIQKSIDRLNARLDKLESAAPQQSAPHIQYAPHPSQDHFAVAEAIVDSLFSSDAKEKACTFEPDRPCDHCSMCNSRGF